MVFQVASIERGAALRSSVFSLRSRRDLLDRVEVRRVMEDLDDETLDAILTAEVSERSKALNHLMDDTGAS